MTLESIIHDQQQLDLQSDQFDQRFPISSKAKGKRFGFFFIVGMLVSVVFFASLCVISFKYMGLALTSEYLWRYQLDKIDNATEVNTVFVGDSSLGNAINSEYFTELTGKKSINLALTRLFLFAGAYNVTKRIAQTNDIKNVVLMVTPNSAAKKIRMEGFIRTTNLKLFEWSDLEFLTKEQYKEILIKFVFHFLNPKVIYDTLDYCIKTYIHKKSVKGQMSYLIKDDYVIQKGRLDIIKENTLRFFHEASLKTTGEQVALHKKAFLNKLIKFCKERGINLIYTHGPILDQYYSHRAKHYSDVRHFETPYLEKQPMTLLTENTVTFPVEHLGNTIHHVWPEYKKDYTKIYADMIGPHLR